ncbi:MAG: FMN-binding glutamate synthase family protein, partial [Thermodesulfobacteriota bacterium]
GKNAEKWLRGEAGGLPATVSRFGSTKEEIFMNYEVLKEKYGSEAEKLPLGAVGLYSATDKIRVGLQQLMAGSRNWEVKYISRKDLFSLTEDCAKITGIPYVMDAYRQEALDIIDA